MSKAKINKAKTSAPSKAKTQPQKAKPVGNGKQPETQSAAAQAGLASVAARPVKISKLDTIIQLLMRPEGTTIDDMVAATGWQKHTVRAALSHALAKKRGYQIVSEKPQGGPRIYKITAGA